MRAIGRERLLAATTLALVAGLGAAPVTPDEPDLPPGPPLLHFVGPRGRAFEAALTHAVTLATERLARLPCSSVLSEFRDGSGRALRARLDPTPERVSAYLETLLFYDADRTLLCQSSLRLAAAERGGHWIAICGERFRRLEARDPAFAAALMLHETLHTLGLGEDPPSSAEITERVLARCGR